MTSPRPGASAAAPTPRTWRGWTVSFAALGILALLLLSGVSAWGSEASRTSPSRAPTGASAPDPLAPSATHSSVHPSSAVAPHELGPVDRSLTLFNNSVENGVGNSTNFVDASQAIEGPSSSDLFLVSAPTSTLEEVDPATMTALWAIPIPSGAFGVAYDPSDSALWVAGGSSGNLTEVSLSNDSIEWHGPVDGATGSTISSATYDPALSALLLTNSQTDQLLFFDPSPSSRTVTSRANVGTGPETSVVDSATGDIAVVDQFSNNLTIVSGSTLLPIKSVNVGSGPISAVDLPTQSEMATTNGGSGNVTFVSTSTWSVVANVAVGTSPEGIAYDPQTGDAVVPDYGSANVTLLDVASHASVGQLTNILEPYAVVYDGSPTDELLVSSFRANNLTVLDGGSDAVLGEIPLGSNPSDVVMDTTNGLLYLANSEPGEVVVINPVSFHVVAWIPVGPNPTAIAFNPDTFLDQVYVANSGYSSTGFVGSLSVIDATTNRVVATLPTYNQPDDIAFDPQNQRVYVADGGGPANAFVGEISVFYASNDSYPSAAHDLNITSGLCSEPDGLAYDPVGGIGDLLVGCERGDGVDIVNTTTDAVVDSVLTNGATSNERYDPFDRSVFVTGITNDAIFQLNATTFANMSYISTGIGVPTDVDIDTNNGYVAVAVEAAGLVYLINENASLVAKVQVGDGPDAIGFDPVQGDFYVDNALGGTESELPILTPEFFRAIPRSITLGNSTTLDIYVPDGNATSTEKFSYVPPTGCTSQNTSLLRCAPTAVGTYTVEAIVQDGYVRGIPTKIAYDNTTFSVNPKAIVALAVSPNPSGVDTSVTFATTTTLGTPPYSYSYAGLPPGCTTADLASLTCTPTAAGTYSVVVSVEDSDQVTVTAAVDLTVNPGPSILSFTATPSEDVEGRTTDLAVDAQGGTGALSYAYGGLPAGCFSEDMSTLACTPAIGGSFTVSVEVTDTAGHAAWGNVSLVVVAGLSASLSASPNPVTAGQTTTLQVSTQGGGGGLTFLYSGLPTGCTTANTSALACATSSTGATSPQVFEVKVTVFDHLGETVVKYTNVTVDPAGTSGSFDLLILAGAGIAVVVALVAVFALLRRRKSRGRGGQDQGPEPYAGEPIAYAPGPGVENPYDVNPGPPPAG